MEKHYVVLYTNQKHKKAKTWHDGTLKLSSQGTMAVLYDDKDCRLDCIHVKDINLGEQLESDRYYILIEELKQLAKQDEVHHGAAVPRSEIETLSQQRPLSQAKCVGLKRKNSGFMPPRILKQPCLQNGTNSFTCQNPSDSALTISNPARFQEYKNSLEQNQAVKVTDQKTSTERMIDSFLPMKNIGRNMPDMFSRFNKDTAMSLSMNSTQGCSSSVSSLSPWSLYGSKNCSPRLTITNSPNLIKANTKNCASSTNKVNSSHFNNKMPYNEMPECVRKEKLSVKNDAQPLPFGNINEDISGHDSLLTFNKTETLNAPVLTSSEAKQNRNVIQIMNLLCKKEPEQAGNKFKCQQLFEKHHSKSFDIDSDKVTKDDCSKVSYSSLSGKAKCSPQSNKLKDDIVVHSNINEKSKTFTCTNHSTALSIGNLTKSSLEDIERETSMQNHVPEGVDHVFEESDVMVDVLQTIKQSNNDTYKADANSHDVVAEVFVSFNLQFSPLSDVTVSDEEETEVTKKYEEEEQLQILHLKNEKVLDEHIKSGNLLECQKIQLNFTSNLKNTIVTNQFKTCDQDFVNLEHTSEAHNNFKKLTDYNVSVLSNSEAIHSHQQQLSSFEIICEPDTVTGGDNISKIEPVSKELSAKNHINIKNGCNPWKVDGKSESFDVSYKEHSDDYSDDHSDDKNSDLHKSYNSDFLSENVNEFLVPSNDWNKPEKSLPDLTNRNSEHIVELVSEKNYNGNHFIMQCDSQNLNRNNISSKDEGWEMHKSENMHSFMKYNSEWVDNGEVMLSGGSRTTLCNQDTMEFSSDSLCLDNHMNIASPEANCQEIVFTQFLDFQADAKIVNAVLRINPKMHIRNEGNIEQISCMTDKYIEIPHNVSNKTFSQRDKQFVSKATFQHNAVVDRNEHNQIFNAGQYRSIDEFGCIPNKRVLSERTLGSNDQMFKGGFYAAKRMSEVENELESQDKIAHSMQLDRDVPGDIHAFDEERIDMEERNTVPDFVASVNNILKGYMMGGVASAVVTRQQRSNSTLLAVKQFPQIQSVNHLLQMNSTYSSPAQMLSPETGLSGVSSPSLFSDEKDNTECFFIGPKRKVLMSPVHTVFDGLSPCTNNESQESRFSNGHRADDKFYSQHFCCQQIYNMNDDNCDAAFECNTIEQVSEQCPKSRTVTLEIVKDCFEGNTSKNVVALNKCEKDSFQDTFISSGSSQEIKPQDYAGSLLYVQKSKNSLDCWSPNSQNCESHFMQHLTKNSNKCYQNYVQNSDKDFSQKTNNTEDGVSEMNGSADDDTCDEYVQKNKLGSKWEQYIPNQAGDDNDFDLESYTTTVVSKKEKDFSVLEKTKSLSNIHIWLDQSPHHENVKNDCKIYSISCNANQNVQTAKYMSQNNFSENLLTNSNLSHERSNCKNINISVNSSFSSMDSFERLLVDETFETDHSSVCVEKIDIDRKMNTEQFLLNQDVIINAGALKSFAGDSDVSKFGAEITHKKKISRDNDDCEIARQNSFQDSFSKVVAEEKLICGEVKLCSKDIDAVSTFYLQDIEASPKSINGVDEEYRNKTKTGRSSESFEGSDISYNSSKMQAPSCGAFLANVTACNRFKPLSHLRTSQATGHEIRRWPLCKEAKPYMQAVSCTKLQFPSKSETETTQTMLRVVFIPHTFSFVNLYKETMISAIIEYVNTQLFDVARRYHHALLKVNTSQYSEQNLKSHSKQANSAFPDCNCGAPAKMVAVKKEGPNNGRYFYTCNGNRKQQCKFFQWADKNSNVMSIPGVGKKLIKDGHALNTYMKSQHIHFYGECELTTRTKDTINSYFKPCKRTSYIQHTDTVQKKQLFLRLPYKEHSSLYAKDDLWVISHNLDFDHQSSFIAKSTFHGPSSSQEVELEPLDGYSPSNWPNGVVCHAILVGNASFDLSCMENIKEHIQAQSPLVITSLLNRQETDTQKVANQGFQIPKFVTHMQKNRNIFIHSEVMDNMARQYTQKFHLNVDQAEALRRVGDMFCIEKTYTVDSVLLIHGVFGAGKTFLLSVIVLFLVEVFHLNDSLSPGQPFPWKLLISSTTNVAIDRILIGLLELGFEDFVRVGSVKKIAKPVLPFSVHASGTDNQELKELQEMLRNGELAMAEKRNQFNVHEWNGAMECPWLSEDTVTRKKCLSCTLPDMCNMCHEPGNNVMHIMCQKLLKVRVVGVTCASCLLTCLSNMQFPMVMLDECSQMTEPSSLLPIARFNCHKLLLVGDPKQLEPTVQGSDAAHQNGLEQTLFDRLIKMGCVPAVLRTQYRCHPYISALANKLFYDGIIIDGLLESQRHKLVDILPTICFFNVEKGVECCEGAGSYFNEQEAQFVVYLLQILLLCGIEPSSVGVITMYRSQMFRIADCLTSYSDMKGIQVSTVDAFQGGERDIIILSTVRTNACGFIDNDKRTNVSLTRARKHLLIVGKLANLSGNALWSKVIEHCNGFPDSVQSEDKARHLLNSYVENIKAKASFVNDKSQPNNNCGSNIDDIDIARNDTVDHSKNKIAMRNLGSEMVECKVVKNLLDITEATATDENNIWETETLGKEKSHVKGRHRHADNADDIEDDDFHVLKEKQQTSEAVSDVRSISPPMSYCSSEDSRGHFSSQQDNNLLVFTDKGKKCSAILNSDPFFTETDDDEELPAFIL